MRTKSSQARPGNQNAKKTLAWVESYDLTSRSGVDAFLQEVVKKTWTGELGSRACGAINGTMKILIEHEVLPELERRIKLLEQSREVRQ